MWLQCVASILPRVQQHFAIPDNQIGLMSSAIFTGMMIGALFWGFFSDVRGRRLAFTCTMLLSSIFGIASAFSPSYPVLCVMFLFLGFGVGGNMPVDGALFLEFIPVHKQYLLTFLSVFFSTGAVFTSALSWAMLPRFSCPINTNSSSSSSSLTPECDPAQNQGWRYLLGTLGLFSFLMFASRWCLFRLPESPKFLLIKGRREEAASVLTSIIRANGDEVGWVVKPDDLASPPPSPTLVIGTGSSSDEGGGGSSGSEEDGVHDHHHSPHSSSHGYGGATRRRSVPHRMHSDPSPRSSQGPLQWIRRQVQRSIRTLGPLFSRRMRRTTILVWIIWVLINLAYTMFNVFLPKFLESRGVADDESSDSRSAVYRDYFIYTLCSVPGAMVGTWLVETKLGRKGSMALTTWGSAGAMFIFVGVKSGVGITISSGVLNFLGTAMYAIVYSYTPEVFDARIRGSACGIASALGRVAGIIAPILTGLLLSLSIAVPLWVSAAVFALAGGCMVLLPIETRGRVAT